MNNNFLKEDIGLLEYIRENSREFNGRHYASGLFGEGHIPRRLINELKKRNAIRRTGLLCKQSKDIKKLFNGGKYLFKHFSRSMFIWEIAVNELNALIIEKDKLFYRKG